MFIRSWNLYAIAIPLASCAAVACSAANSGNTNGTGANDTQGDSGSGDSGVELAPDSGVVQNTPPPGCPGPTAASTTAAPVGTLLASGNSLSARGVTSDGYEIYSDDYAFQLYAVPIAGGSSQTIASLGSNFWVTVVGQVVFAWSNVTGAAVGALTVWSSAAGSHALDPASFGILGSSSPDGSQVLYVGNVDAQGQTGDVFVASTNGSGSTRLLQGQQLTGCFPQLGFAGSYAIATHCDVAPGTGPSATISSFASPAWTRADLATNAENIWSADNAGTIVLASTGGGVMVVPIGGGAATTIDSSGFMGQLILGGQAAVYSTVTGNLRRSAVTAPSPMTLASGVGGFYGFSPSWGSVLYYQNQATNGTDLYLSSTAMAGSQQTISTAQNVAVNGDAFTTDSNYALYSTSNNVCTGAAAFNALAVSGGSPIPLGTNVWDDWAATGSKVVFSNNYVATGGLRYGRADIESVDLANGTTPTVVVSQADAIVDLNPAGDHIIYSWSLQPGPLAGIYITPVP
jgi:hypothetical protein